MLSNPTIVVEACVNQLFDDPKYPRAEVNKGKRKQSEREDEDRRASGSGDAADKEKRARLDWESLDRVVADVDYASLTMVGRKSFVPKAPHPPLIPFTSILGGFRPELQVHHEILVRVISQLHTSGSKTNASAFCTSIREALVQRNWLYFPTYFHLREVSSDPGFRAHKKTATTVKRKGKGPQGYSAEFERERQAVLAVLAQEQDPNYAPSPPQQAGSGAVAVDPADVLLPEGEGIECGCCFGEYEFDQMIQCPEAHLFCKDCSRRNAAEALGQRKSAITCMDQSGKSRHLDRGASPILNVRP